jgi:hypothetical protein
MNFNQIIMLRKLNLLFRNFKSCWWVALLTLFNPALGQQSDIALNDLSFFQSAGPSWKIVSDVHADLAKDGILNISEGNGILVNRPDKKKPGKDLFSVKEYGDMDIALDYMLARASNSGIYLQGRYEVQLLDSWAVKNPRAGDNGGIYERWDESKPEGQKGYEGYAPRQNVSRGPGLWQHLKISFQAPRFDASGNKVENAKMLKVELNGVVIQENIELFGPTRGAMGDEAALGPLRIQGDHGAVAFRNMAITVYDKPQPKIADLKFELYMGRFTNLPNFDSLKADEKGTVNVVGQNLGSVEDEFAIRYRGNLTISERGQYSFKTSAPGGMMMLRIGETEVIPFAEGRGSGSATLQPGKFPIEIVYSKYADWARSSLSLTIEGAGIREYLASDRNLRGGNSVDPVYVTVAENKLLRSFMDLPGGHRVVHAVSLGSHQKLHYTYDMDNGTIVQLWRGEFLDATPMWHSRGDGSSRPVGSVHRFGKPVPTVARLATAQSEWISDTTGSSFRTKGYTLNANEEPTFRYQIFGAFVSDATRVIDNGQGISRTISVANAGENFYVRLAEGKSVKRLSENLYLIDDKSYYLRLDDPEKNKVLIRDANGRKEIIIPIQNSVTYSILF